MRQETNLGHAYKANAAKLERAAVSQNQDCQSGVVRLLDHDLLMLQARSDLYLSGWKVGPFCRPDPFIEYGRTNLPPVALVNFGGLHGDRAAQPMLCGEELVGVGNEQYVKFSTQPAAPTKCLSWRN